MLSLAFFHVIRFIKYKNVSCATAATLGDPHDEAKNKF